MMRRIWLFPIAVTLAAGAIPLAATGDIHHENAAPSAHDGAEPLPQRLVAAPGIVEPETEERDIAASVTGALKGPMPKEGERVTAGEIVAEVANDDVEAELAGARARVAIRQSELARLMAGARAEERREAAAELQQAQAQLELAQKNMGRRQSLVHDGIASVESADGARADYQTASAHRDLMAAKLDLITAPPRPEDVAIAEANLAAAKANVGDLQARLEKTRMRSPIDGVILKRYKMPGETVSDMPPTVVVKIGDISRLRVRVEVDAADIARVGVGQPVSVTADAFGERRFTGTVVQLAARLGPKYIRTDAPGERFDTKTLEALVQLDGHPPLPVGLRVDVSFGPVPEG